MSRFHFVVFKPARIFGMLISPSPGCSGSSGLLGWLTICCYITKGGRIGVRDSGRSRDPVLFYKDCQTVTLNRLDKIIGGAQVQSPGLVIHHVTMITGISAKSESFFSLFRTVHPSHSGMTTSRVISSGRSFLARRKPSSPFARHSRIQFRQERDIKSRTEKKGFRLAKKLRPLLIPST